MPSALAISRDEVEFALGSKRVNMQNAIIKQLRTDIGGHTSGIWFLRVPAHNLLVVTYKENSRN